MGETVEKAYIEQLEAECFAAEKEKAQLREAIYDVGASMVQDALYKVILLFSLGINL